MRRGFLTVAVAAAIITTAGAPAARAASSKMGTVTLSRVVQKLPAGKVWATYQEGVLCVSKRRLTGDGVQQPMPMNLFGPLFMRALAGAGRLDENDRPNLFAEPTPAQQTVAYEIGALIHDVDMKLCGLSWGEESLGVKGKVTAQVQWQIYSPAKREVVATIETTGVYETRRLDGAFSAADVAELVMRGGFLESAKQLVATAQFKALMDAPPPKDALQSTPGQQEKIVASGTAPVQRPVPDAVGSVVAIVLPDGHGSGVLVSNDGYLLTNAHVVGQRQTVKVRWSDGFEADGQVLRVHKDRDVALVKADPHGRLPLPIRPSAVQPGDTVMAIGAPLDLQWQGTVTRGIVSNVDRIFKGYSFIQSDVMVNPGNSGGALIDEKGFLVGLTDLGFQLEGAPAGLNYFIPIKDALQFVSLELTTPPPAPAMQRTSATTVPSVARRGGR